MTGSLGAGATGDATGHASTEILCSILAALMLNRLSFSENRHFQHTFVPHLLRPGDAFVCFQEPCLSPDGNQNHHMLLLVPCNTYRRCRPTCLLGTGS